jgi:hypothetical protein
MTHYNTLNGDTLEDARLGDSFTNHYGEVWQIVGESQRGRLWLTVNATSGRNGFAHKYDKQRIITATLPEEAAK